MGPVKRKSRTLLDKKELSLESSLESLKIIFDAKMIRVFDPCSLVNKSKSSTKGNNMRLLSDVKCLAAIVIKSFLVFKSDSYLFYTVLRLFFCIFLFFELPTQKGTLIQN